LSALEKAAPSKATPGSLDAELVRGWIKDEMLKMTAQDKTGMADWALKSIGGKILNQSPSFQPKTPQSTWNVLSWLRDCSGPMKYADEMLTPDMTPGSCWPMEG
jgi:hypothetical protein